MSEIVLYDLAAQNKDVRFSPFCWLAKFGLLHKGLDFDTVALGFLPKSDYPDEEYGKLPVLKDGDKMVKDSAEILAYLEKTYPEKPLSHDQAMSDKMNSWLGEELFPVIAPLLMNRVANALPPEEEKYFRESRSERFGMSLEDLAETVDPGKLTAAFETAAGYLGDKPFFGGNSPDLSDYIIASPLMWQISISNNALYDMPAPIADWFERMRASFDGYCAKAECAGC